MTSIITKIINREISSYTVYEDNNFIAFLDINPIKKGHILLVPKQEVDKVYDLTVDDFNLFFDKGRELAQKMDRAIPIGKPELDVKRIGFVVEGFGVPHAHLHLIPVSKGNELNPENAYKASPEELMEMQSFYKEIF